MSSLLTHLLCTASVTVGGPSSAGSPAVPRVADPVHDRALFLDAVAASSVAEHPEPAYRFVADHLSDIAPYVRDRPGVVQVERIGQSVEGRPLWAFHVADPTAPITQTVLVTASIHALEWVGTEVATDLIVRLAEDTAPGVRVTIVPWVNPDGRARVEADLLAGRNTYRRSNAQGVDLNRDFPTNREAKAIWRHIIPRRYTTSPAPLSQPESQAIDRLAAREHFDVAVSLHAFGGYIYYPWAGLWERPEDRERFVELGHVMQSGQGARAYRVQQLSHWAFFFRGHGMELDHLYAAYGTHAFLVELTRSGLSLRHLADRKVNFRWYNPRDPQPDIDRGVGALRALVDHLASE